MHNIENSLVIAAVLEKLASDCLQESFMITMTISTELLETFHVIEKLKVAHERLTDVDLIHSELFHHDWDSEDFLTFFHKPSFSSKGFYKIPFILILSLDSIYSG